jgi:2-keto-3-deoxy-L-rhamnonate aldolase RhmA
MKMHRLTFSAAAAAALWITAAAWAEPPAARSYNTVKQKLAAGKQVFGGTISTNDPNIYCAMAEAGFDYLWIEMQHNTISYHEAALMIRACKGAPALPFVRVPDATEGDIQKAVDMGALGIIVPMVDTIEKVKNAVTFAKYPPVGKRSQGGGQYGALWGRDYRETANDNIMIIAMIESPAGVKIASEIASVPGIDVVFIASTDLGSFMGRKQGEPEYEAAVTKAREAILKAGKVVGGPSAWRSRPGYHFFQAASDTSLIKTGAETMLGLKGEASSSERRGVAPIEGREK